MAVWYTAFQGTLALHQDGCVAASQETRRVILRTVRDHIVSKNKSEDESVELPKALKMAIRRYYHQFLTDEDDIQAEDEILGDVPEDEPCGLSPEEREAAARPKDAAFYKKEASDWDVAQKLFKQEIDEYDKEEQAKLGVKNEIKHRTGHARNWFKNMTPAQKKEVENAREKWNSESAPLESQAMYRKRHLKKTLDDFTEQLRRTMGCQVMILTSHKKSADQTLSVVIHESKSLNSKKPFTQSSRGNKDWVSQGFEKFAEWSKSEFYPEENDDESDEEEEDDGKDSLPELILDKSGYPMLPSRVGVATRGQQELVRQIFRASYKVLTNTAKPVPWRKVVGNPTLYLDSDSLPEGFILRDPSHMRAENINQLWGHWEARKAAKKKLVIFVAAKLGDMSKEWLKNAVPYQEKSKKKYVKIQQDTPARPHSATRTEQLARVAASSKGAASTRPTPGATRPARGNSESESAGAAATGRRASPAESDSSEDELPAAAPAASRTRMATRPSSAQLGAPATVPIKDRITFLKSLSSNSEYLLLVEAIRDLGKEPSIIEQTAWPAWATWSWEGSYLPSDLHSVDGEARKFLEMSVSTKISGLVSAMRVSLGLGLLLRECKRAIEYEADEATSDTPPYISSSKLDIGILDLVIEAVSKVRGGAMHLLKARDIQQERPIINKAANGEGHGAQVDSHVPADGGDGEVEREKSRGEAEKHVGKERKDEKGEEEEEEKVEEKGKKRTKSGGSRKPSKKAKSEVRKSGRTRQPTQKALNL
ncbi:hypothetical protein F4604DRAFT_1926547 [Suillus subluteus]|nr:hypothetical protein F4604DRAFT_1926547 [Suillus subluteus]